MTSYVVHDAAGAILWCGKSSASAEDLAAQPAPEGGTLLVVAEDITDQLAWRVVAGALVARAVMAPTLSAATIVADGVASAVLSGLPNPCTVTVLRQPPGGVALQAGVISQGPEEVTSGSLALTSATPGRLRITVTAGLGYAPWAGVVDAEAAA